MFQATKTEIFTKIFEIFKEDFDQRAKILRGGFLLKVSED